MPNGPSSPVRLSLSCACRADTDQAHILTNITFRHCGAPSAFGEGCGVDGCHAASSTWQFLCHSDEHVPEWMQATARVNYDGCGRRFRCNNFWRDAGRDINNGMDSTLQLALDLHNTVQYSLVKLGFTVYSCDQYCKSLPPRRIYSTEIARSTGT